MLIKKKKKTNMILYTWMSRIVFLLALLLAGKVAMGQVKDTAGLHDLYNKAYSKLFDEENYTEAIELFNQYIAHDTSNPDAYLYRGRSFFWKEDYINALKDYQTANQKSKKEAINLDYFMYMGQLLYITREYKKSITYYDTIINAGQGSNTDFFERARSKKFSGDCKAALPDIDTALKLNPDHISSHIERGDILACLGRNKEAVAEYDYVLGKDSTDIVALFNRALAKNSLEDHEGALADFNRYEKLNPGNKDLYYQRGLVEIDIEDYEAALKDFNSVIAKDSLYMDVFWRRGVANGNLERYDEAIEDFNKQLRIKPDCNDCILNRAVMLVKQNKYEEAYKDLDAAAKYIKGDPYEIYKIRVQALAYQKKYALAETYVNRYAKTAATPIQKFQSLELWSLYYLAKKDTLGSIGILSKINKLYPDNSANFYTRAVLTYAYYTGHKNPDKKLVAEMVADVNRAIELNPEFGEAYFLRAVIKSTILNLPAQVCPDLWLAKQYGLQDKVHIQSLEISIVNCK